MYAVLVENDESPWHDQTGVAYHFPKRYAKHIPSGTSVIFYKGKIRNKAFASERLSAAPHYFAIATIGKTYPDPASSKGDQFALIENYLPFSSALLSKQNEQFLEPIPSSKMSNYWRDGVRTITEATYKSIAKLAQFDTHNTSTTPTYELNDTEQALESLSDGNASKRFTTVYERNPRLRKQALLVHGTTCKACGFNFKKFYGEYAGDFIHIHHIRPVSDGVMIIDPEKDLVPLCANCHAIVHRRKDKVLTIEELRTMIQIHGNFDDVGQNLTSIYDHRGNE